MSGWVEFCYVILFCLFDLIWVDPIVYSTQVSKGICSFIYYFG
jgi:hypothetical protein